MNKRIVVLALAAAILAPATLSAREIKVGVILPYSGVSALFAQQIDRGMMLYYDEHKGELGADKLTLIKRDFKGPNADTAKVLAQELITREHVAMLAGFGSFAERNGDRAADQRGQISGHHHERRNRTHHHHVALLRARLVHDVAVGLHDGQIRG